MDRVSTDWRLQHYPATPEQGIDFTQPGWPDFVHRSFGISKVEGFGRWTDTKLGLKAGFEFNRSFSGPVCVVLDAVPSESMRSRHARVAFGDQQQDIIFGNDKNLRSFQVDFVLPGPTSTLVLLFPKRLPRSSPDSPRELGVGMNRLRILSHPCATLSPPITGRP